MATYTKRQGKRGVRWTVRVRLGSRKATKTFGSKAAAETWARLQEAAIENRELPAARPVNGGTLLQDVIEKFLEHRRETVKRPPGATFANALARLKDAYGLEHLGALDVDFWHRHALARIRDGASGSTVAGDLAYAGSVLAFAKREKLIRDATGPGEARALLLDDGIKVTSNKRTRRITDSELKRLFAWIDANEHRTSLPLRDLVEFALATGMRRGEILALERSAIEGRVANIKRKHPKEQDRRDDVPLIKPGKGWPRVDPLAIIRRQPKTGLRVFPYKGDTLSFWFEAACEGAKLEGVVFHLLRHECLSRLAERGFDPLRLALVGGHRDLRNVKRYAKLDAAKVANE